MDKELRIIRHLYGEDEHPEEVSRLLASDDALRKEYHELRVVKQQLDGRGRQRPDAGVLAHITEAAAQASTEGTEGTTSRRDRPPVARQRHRRRQRIGIAAAVAVVLMVSIGLWQWPGTESGGPAQASKSESVAVATDPSSASAGESSSASGSNLPSWDEGDDVVRLYRYIETLQARSSPAHWDSAEMPIQSVSQMPSNR